MTRNLPSGNDADPVKTLVYAATPQGKESMATAFPIAGSHVIECHDFEEAKTLLKDGGFRYLFSDLTEHDPKGKELVDWAKEHCPDIRPFLYANSKKFQISADYWRLMPDGLFHRCGVGDDDLTLTLNRMFHDFSGVSWIGIAKNELNRIRKEIDNKKGAVVLLKGEAGTARSSLAQLAHFHSSRKYKRFILVDCRCKTGPVDIYWDKEDEERFTDTIQAIMREGEGGTVYFRYVDLLPPEAQDILCRQLRMKPTAREKNSPYPLVVACSTTVPPATLLGERKIKRDLFDILNVHVMTIPSITEYRENIRELANELNSCFCKIMHMPLRPFTKDAIDALEHHSWTGNIREFFCVIKHVAGTCRKKKIGKADLQLDFHITSRDSDSDKKRKIKELLKRNDGNKSAVAEFFEISRKTLYEWMKKYDISKDYK